MDMQQIGYYLYMEKQEKKKQQKVNEEKYGHLVGTEATTNEKEDHKNIFPERQPVPRRIMDKAVDSIQATAAAIDNSKLLYGQN